MRWEDERYVRVYTRDTAEWLALGWEAQALLTLSLRKADRAGVVRTGRLGAKGLALMVGMPEDVTARALGVLLEDGCVQMVGDGLLIKNFMQAQEVPTSDAERKRQQRERDRATLMASAPEQVSRDVTPVTTGHAESRKSRGVTNGHENVTPNLTVPSLTEPKETLVDRESAADPPVDDKPATPKLLPAEPEAPDSAVEVFAHWRQKVRHLQAQFSPKRRRAVKARLAEGRTVAELCLAIDGCALTPHNQGQNDTGQKWDDLELICRSNENVERFMRNALDPPQARTKSGAMGPVRAESTNWDLEPKGDVSDVF